MIRENKKVEYYKMENEWLIDIFKKGKYINGKEIKKQYNRFDRMEKIISICDTWHIYIYVTRITYEDKETWLVDWVLKHAPIDQLLTNRPSQFSVWNLQFFTVYIACAMSRMEQLLFYQFSTIFHDVVISGMLCEFFLS